MTIQQMMLGGNSFPPLEAFANPTAVAGSPPPTRPGLAFAGPSLVTASGGSGSYTYWWSWVSGDTETSMQLTPDSAGMSWSRLIPTMPGTWISLWRCQVSDGITTLYTNTVTVTFSG